MPNILGKMSQQRLPDNTPPLFHSRHGDIATRMVNESGTPLCHANNPIATSMLKFNLLYFEEKESVRAG